MSHKDFCADFILHEGNHYPSKLKLRIMGGLHCTIASIVFEDKDGKEEIIPTDVWADDGMMPDVTHCWVNAGTAEDLFNITKLFVGFDTVNGLPTSETTTLDVISSYLTELSDEEEAF